MKTKLITLFVGLALSTAGFSAPAREGGGTKAYPLKTCVVSGNELGSMGTPITKVHNGQEIKFCCKPCVKKFEAKPDKYLPKVK